MSQTERVWTFAEQRIGINTLWGDGPWQTEPDKVQWLDEQTGYTCLAVRNMKLGNWCGYVGVPEGHPAFEKGYDSITVRLKDEVREFPIRVHGGMTYADFCNEHGRICHVPFEGQPERIWWLGFDCAHAYDLVPFTHKYLGGGADLSR